MTFGWADGPFYNVILHFTNFGEDSFEWAGKHVSHSIFSKARQIMVLWF